MAQLSELLPDFDQIITRIALTANVDNLLVAGNSSRFAILFSIPVANLVYVNPGPMAAGSLGIPLAAGFQTSFYNFRDYGQMVCRDWHGFTAVPGQTIMIIETIYRPK